MMKVHVDNAGDILEKTTDARGRLNLGTRYKNKTVTIAILDVEDGETAEATAPSDD